MQLKYSDISPWDSDEGSDLPRNQLLPKLVNSPHRPLQYPQAKKQILTERKRSERIIPRVYKIFENKNPPENSRSPESDKLLAKHYQSSSVLNKVSPKKQKTVPIAAIFKTQSNNETLYSSLPKLHFKKLATSIEYSDLKEKLQSLFLRQIKKNNQLRKTQQSSINCREIVNIPRLATYRANNLIFQPGKTLRFRLEHQSRR